MHFNEHRYLLPKYPLSGPISSIYTHLLERSTDTNCVASLKYSRSMRFFNAHPNHFFLWGGIGSEPWPTNPVTLPVLRIRIPGLVVDNHLDDYVNPDKALVLTFLAILISTLSSVGMVTSRMRLASLCTLPSLDVSLNLVFITRIRMDYVPLSGTIANVDFLPSSGDSVVPPASVFGLLCRVCPFQPISIAYSEKL